MSKGERKSKSENYHDLVVIGAGPGGYVAAIRAAQLGLNVGCVDKDEVLGGTCLRIGCIPSKALLESSERYWEAQQSSAQHGIKMSELSFDLTTMMQRKSKVVDGLTQGVAALFKKNKVTRYTGHASLGGKGRVQLKTKDEIIQLRAKHIVLATGSRPATLNGVELDQDRIGTSSEALSYPEVPQHLVVIGAGYIGLELGSVWRRLGAKVTVVEVLDRILPGMDSELAFDAQRSFEEQGINFRFYSKVQSARRQEDRCIVDIEGSEPIDCDRVLLAVGRVPVTENLGLEEMGVKLDEKGRIKIDERFSTTVEGVSAIGDLIPGPMLAHKAQEEGVAIAELLANESARVDYNTIPAVVYTHPEFAAVGKTEDQLKDEGIGYLRGVFPFTANGRAQTLGQVKGKVKILSDKKTDRVLGIHILGARAGELIGEAAASMAFGASSEDIARCCHAHPTLSEALHESALAVRRQALHI